MNDYIYFFCVGTGGHVLPAKNIINELISNGFDNKKIGVITDYRGEKYLNDLNVDIFVINFYSSSSGKLNYIFNSFKLIKSTTDILKILKGKNIKIVFSTGSYVSPIAAIIGKLKKSLVFLQEQNKFAGLGNKIATIFANKVFTSFESTENINNKKLIYTGPVVNTNLNPFSKIDNIVSIGFVGGSQGSDEINSIVEKFVYSDLIDSYKVLHITGKQKSLNVAHENYISFEFVENMDDFYEKVQLIVGRSGGGSLEPAYLGIPQILIPFKHGTTSSHQYLNAKFLEDNNFGHIVNNFDELEKLLKNINDVYLKDKSQTTKIPNGKRVISEIVYEEFFK